MNYGEWKADYEDRGRCAYEAFLRASGGKSPMTGEALPAWEEQPAEFRAGWLAVANAVCERYGAIY